MDHPLDHQVYWLVWNKSTGTAQEGSLQPQLSSFEINSMPKDAVSTVNTGVSAENTSTSTFQNSWSSNETNKKDPQ